MWFLSAFYLLLSLASAAKVSISFTLDQQKNLSSIFVYRRRGGIIIGKCGNIIKAAAPIDFSQVTVVDGIRSLSYGNYISEGLTEAPVTSGNFTIGDNTYAIQPDPVYSGGPSCKTDVEFVNNRISIYCKNLWWDYSDFESKPVEIETNCFGDLPLVKDEHESDYYTNVENEPYNKSLIMPKLRLNPRCSKGKPPALDGAGWPHTRYLYKQVSEVVECGKNQSCCVGKDNSDTFSFMVMLTTPDFPFIGGNMGFAITKGWTTGNSHTCNGNPGDKVCVWYKVAHTAITVRHIGNAQGMRWNSKYPKCWTFGKQYLVVAPNQDNDGGGFSCRYNNECKTKNDEYWDCNGRAESRLTYCPPSGFPQKLHRDSASLPQCIEKEAVGKLKSEKKKRIVSTGGKKAWKDYERKRKAEEKKLKREYKIRTADEKEREKMEEKKEKEAEKEKKKEAEKGK